MGGNKYLVPDKSTLLKNKLQKLSEKFNKSTRSSSVESQEQIVSDAIKAISQFFRGLKDPITELKPVFSDTYPDPSLYNETWEAIINDLTILFLELENIESLTLSNFNFIATESNRLLSRTKSVASKLADLILYSTNPLGNIIYFSDSFNNLSKIDSGSSLLNTDECTVDQDQGVISLPVNTDKEPSILVKEIPIINEASNGVKGNNEQVGASFNGDLKKILDNNPDTWFEYEKVVSTTEDFRGPLVLDFTINVGNPTVINNIRINPNNFGTKSGIVVDKIETSVDGNTYLDVKEEVVIGNSAIEPVSSVFRLSHATSKYAGQAIYSFLPRKAKYIHIVLLQNEPYVIETATGDKLRYAIGIRDVVLNGISYLSTGEIVSQRFNLNEEIRKVLLEANQNVDEGSDIGSVKYYVSADDGISWNEIQPKSFTGESGVAGDIPEILNFNSFEEGSIQTAIPVQSLRLKIEVNRNDNVFEEGASSLRKKTEATSELHEVPVISPFEFTLNNSPVQGTVEVVDPFFGSRGRPEVPYIVGHGVDSNLDSQKFYLPYKNLPKPKKKELVNGKYELREVTASGLLHVEVGGEEWFHATKPIENYSANYSTDKQFKVYHFDKGDSSLRFGNGLDTVRPPVNAPIGIYFEPERLFPSEGQGDHVAKLDFKTNANKNNLTLKVYGKEQNNVTLLPRKSTLAQLEPNITDKTTISSSLLSAGYTTEVEYMNGIDELTTSGQFSIDETNGVLYMENPTPDNRDVSVVYKSQPFEEVPRNLWEFAETNSPRDSIRIKDEAWTTIEQKDLNIPIEPGNKIFDLAHLAVVKGTVKLSLVDSNGDAVGTDVSPFVKEAEFVDGIQELGGSVTLKEEVIPTMTSGSNMVYSFGLQENIIQDSDDYKIAFSDTDVFVTEDSALNDVGDYRIIRDPNSSDYRKVSVKLSDGDDAKDAGTITYFFTDSSVESSGLFSIDYPDGRIFTQRSLPTDNYTLKATYQYTDYRAQYRIARELDENDYEIDIVNNLIKIKDEEILKKGNIPKDKLVDHGVFYQVSYDYVKEVLEDAAELREFFSPVIKDYVLKVLPKSKLIT